jgi:hypothetical protein
MRVAVWFDNSRVLGLIDALAQGFKKAEQWHRRSAFFLVRLQTLDSRREPAFL